MSFTIFGAFPKDSASEVSVRIPALGDVKQEEISWVIKHSPSLLCRTTQSSSEFTEKVSTPRGYESMI